MIQSVRSLTNRVWLLAFVWALAPCASAQAQTTALYLDSQPGEPLGRGTQHTYTPADGAFQVTRNNKNGVSVSVIGPSFSFSWYLDFAAAGNAELGVGAYESARRYPFAEGNGLDVGGNGAGCNDLTGRYVVRQIVMAADGSVLRFAADFEHHCSDMNPGLFGVIRYNSTIADLVPFEGNYPFYELTVVPAAHGRITGAGIDCGGGAASCVLPAVTPTLVRLTATPDSGYAFARWSGDCSGATTTWVAVNQRKRCSAVFESGFQGTTALFLDSQPGETVGQGVQRTLTPLDGTFGAFRNYRNGVNIGWFAPPGMPSSSWLLEFASRGNFPLVEGSYGSAGGWSTPLNALSVSGLGNGCSNLTGRYIVREAVYRADGSVERFAADFELHCSDALPGLFGAIRYNSTISDLTPFGGDYPNYRLTIALPQNGRVTGGGLECGAGNFVCQVSPVAGSRLTITAVPDPGYVFTGWSDDCRGDVSTTVHINSLKACSARFEPLVPVFLRSVAYWDRSFIGGTKTVYTPMTSLWSVTSAGNGNQVRVWIEDVDGYRLVEFSAPEGQRLAPGYYSAARRYPFTPFNGLSVSSTGAGCNELTGRFVILDISIGSDGTVGNFAADFEQHCGDAAAGEFLAIRYNSLSAVPVVPFSGAYPSYHVSVTPAAHGRVSGTDLSCGSGSALCQQTLPAVARITLTATPNSGYTFMGWTEDCSGGATTSLHVNGPKRCSAIFEPIEAAALRTILRWDSQPGNYIGGGLSEVLSPGNSRWSPTSLQSGNGVEVRVDSVGPVSNSYWSLRFQAPTGQPLQAGQYAGADYFPAAGVPGFSISGNGRGCGGGTFTVRELAFGSGNTVLRFAVDFVLNCGSATGPLLTGSLQYNSTVDIPTIPLSIVPSSLRFGGVHNGLIITSQTAPQTVRLIMTPGIPWTATASQPFIVLSPSSGTGPALMRVTLGVTGGNPLLSTFPLSVRITLGDASGTSRTLELSLSVYPTGSSTSPFGVIDTPLQNVTGVTGAIPVTGWALDDLEVTGVTICRVAVGGEVAPVDANCGGAAQIFVGNAVFIEGARPDVQASYSTYPRNNVGGWGFMLLTNTLPNQGNGTFVLHAYARDREGHVVQVGTRTITCDNAHATAPFGAIDTPGQGQTVSGATYVNFGWALTPMPKQIPIDGSTLMVYVDGQPIGSPSYNHYRADVATTFPGLANSGGPVGFRYIDTTTLANGLHTIVWTATDSAGVISGLGSRYFRVSNGAAAISTSTTAPMTTIHSDAELATVALDMSSLAGRRSWDAEKPWQNYGVGRSGRAVLRGEEIDRFEIALGEHAGQSYAGYLRVGEGLGPLPIGSRLDARTGAFTWSPGVGFVGTYDLVFVRSARGQPVARREVRFVLQPKGSGHIGAQVVIDTPRSQQDLAQPFALGGWAADLDAPTGTGIDALHVWAYPLTGGAPVFLGTATYGGARPDVAAVHGDQFRDSGFGVLIQGLTPGNYDLAVFAWSGVSGGFVPARVVRVTAR